MNGLAFLASVIQSIAWPVAAVAIAFLLREPLKQLIPLLRRVKYKDLELDFATKLEKLEAKAEAAELPPARPITTTAAEATAEISDRLVLTELAKASPRAAIAEAWRQLEHDVRLVLEQHRRTAPRNTAQMLQAAQDHGILPGPVRALVADLRGLRNQAVHAVDFEVDIARAIEYIDLAERVRASLIRPSQSQ